jgi:hypothetical protein
MPFFLLIARFVHSLFRSQRQLVLENLALRQQVAMLRQSVKKPRPSVADKLFWIVFLRYVDGWRKILCSLHPATVVRWHRQVSLLKIQSCCFLLILCHHHHAAILL